MRVARYTVLFSLLLLAIAIVPTAQVSGGEETICPIHHVPLKKEKLEIIYGLSYESCNPFDLAAASEKYFPYANSVVYGGCIESADSPKDKEVLYCPKCREVEKNWPCLETRETPIITTLPPPRVTRLPTVN